jgi:cell division protein FtsA
MPAKQEFVVGLDIGTNTVTVVAAVAKPTGEVDIVGVGSTQSRGLRKGVVINIEGTVASITKALAQAETMAGGELSSALVSISGAHIKGLNSHGVVAIKGREVNVGDIERVIDAAKAVAIPIDREVLHVLPQEFVIDDQDGIKEPIGISGVRLEARVHIITGGVASAQNIVKCANRCGLVVGDILFGALASGKAVLTAEERDLGVLLIDLGAGTTDLVIYHGGAVKHTAVLPMGGAHITNDIAAGLRTPILSAEEIKCRSGVAIASVVSSQETVEVPSTGGRLPRMLSRHVLAEIVQPRVEEILTMAQREVIKAGFYEHLSGGVVITGGSAQLTGLSQVAERIFNLPVRIGLPIGMSGLAELVQGPQYATAVGLVIAGFERGAASHRNQGRGRLGGVLRRVGNWISEQF